MAIAEDKLKEAMGNFDSLSTKFENLSERQFDKKMQDIVQHSIITQGTMNKQDILGGALAYMASEKDHSEDIADNTGKMVGLLTDIYRKPGAVFG